MVTVQLDRGHVKDTVQRLSSFLTLRNRVQCRVAEPHRLHHNTVADRAGEVLVARTVGAAEAVPRVTVDGEGVVIAVAGAVVVIVVVDVVLLLNVDIGANEDTCE